MYKKLGASAGFEIGRLDDVVLLVNRRTRPPALVAWIFGGLAGIAIVHAVLWPMLGIVGEVQRSGALLVGAILVPIAALLGVVARAAHRRYASRRDAPALELRGLVADLGTGTLRDSERTLAALTDVRIDTPRNLGDSTQGSMRWVRLRWPTGSARIYSAAATDAEAMAADLAELGVGRPR